MRCSQLLNSASAILCLACVVSGQTDQADRNKAAAQLMSDISSRALAGRPSIALISAISAEDGVLHLKESDILTEAELTLRRNGVPVIGACNGGDGLNCGRLVILIEADCKKGLLAPDPTALCAVHLKVAYWEDFMSSRLRQQTGGFSEVLSDEGVKLTAAPIDQVVQYQVSKWIESFALRYLRQILSDADPLSEPLVFPTPRRSLRRAMSEWRDPAALKSLSRCRPRSSLLRSFG